MKAKTENKYLLTGVTKYLFVIFISLLMFSGIGSAATYVVDDMTSDIVGETVNTFSNNNENYTNYTSWKFETNKAVVSSPVYYNETVYFNNDRYTFALNAKSGTIMWKYGTGAEESSPACYGDTIYTVGSSHNLYALNASSGLVRWFIEDIVVQKSTPAIYNDVLYVGGSKVYAIDSITGTLRWNYDSSSESSPAVSNGIVYVGFDDGNVSALNADTGNLIWNYQTDAKVKSSPEISKEFIYIGSQDNFVYALNASTGELSWKYKTDGMINSSPIEKNNLVYIGSSDGYIYCFNATNGNLNWKFQTDGEVTSSPSITNETVFVGSKDSFLYAINSINGTLKWKYRTGYEIISSPEPYDGIIYVGSNDHYLYAIGGNNGVTDVNNSYYFPDTTLTCGESLKLKEGYNLTAIGIDYDGKKGFVKLTKNGKLLDQQILSSGDTYYYNRSINNLNRTIVNFKLEEVFQGQISDLFVIENIKQYPERDSLDTNFVKLLQINNPWNIGNDYSLTFNQIGLNDKIILSLQKNDTIVDTSIMEENCIYRYQRKNEISGDIVNILELPIFDIFHSSYGNYVEFAENYSMYPDANTTDIDDTTLVKSGSSMHFDDGYRITVDDVSAKSKAIIALHKNNIVFDQNIVRANTTYQYSRFDDMYEIIDTILEVDINNMFRSNSASYVEFSSSYNQKSDINTTDIKGTKVLKPTNLWELGNNYEMVLNQIDVVNGDKAWVEFRKNGEYVEDQILIENKKFEFSSGWGQTGQNRTLFNGTLSSIMWGEYDGYVEFDSYYIINSNPKFKMDPDNVKVLSENDFWNVSDYNLTAKMINTSNATVLFELKKDGEVIKEEYCHINEEFEYNVSIYSNNIPVYSVNIRDMFTGSNSDLVQLSDLVIYDVTIKDPYSISKTKPLHKNTSPPSITDIKASNVDTNSASISFDVNQSDAKAKVVYDTFSDLSSSSEIWDNSTSTSRSIEISGLNEDTTYYYSIYAHNGTNSSVFTNSSINSFETVSLTDPNKEVIYEGTMDAGDGYQINNFVIDLADVFPSNEYASFYIYERDSKILDKGLDINDNFTFEIENEEVEVKLIDTIDALIPRAEIIIEINDSDIVRTQGIVDGGHENADFEVAPSITSITVNEIGETTANIYYNVNQPNSNTKVVYSTSPILENSNIIWDNTSSTSRSVSLSGLNPNTNYYYSVYAYNSTLPDLVSNTSIDIFATEANSYHFGNYVWDEEADQSNKYTWDGRSFSGFYFDLDTGDTSESMTIMDTNSRNIDEGDLVYTAKPIDKEFEFAPWGEYQIVGFMTERYFAGYKNTFTSIVDNDLSLISGGILSKVLMDTDDSESIYTGSSLTLEEGYNLNVQQVDVNGDSVWISLTQDGDEVDDAIVSSGDTYVYETDLGDVDDVPVIAVQIDHVSSDNMEDAVYIDGIFQISDDCVEIDLGNKFGEMEVTSLSSTGIEMENEDSISLGQGSIVDIMGDIKFIVADDSTLRFAPFVDRPHTDTYKLRGTIAEDQGFTWTPLNFEGFYYDIDEGLLSESLTVDYDGRTIDDGNLIYETRPISTIFEYDAWGNYNAIGLFGKEYVPVLENEIENLSPLLIDDNKKYKVRMGESLKLAEGYNITPQQIDVDGEKVWIELTKDGEFVDDKVISVSDTTIEQQTWYYEQDVSGVDDVVTLMVHIDVVYKGDVEKFCIIDGVWQISENISEINPGKKFGEMEVSSTSSSITLENNNSITLEEGTTVNIMEDINFMVADSNEVRYYPLSERQEVADEIPTLVSDTYTMSLDKGWNLVSIPIIPVSSSANSIFENNTEVLSPIYSWNPSTKQYYEVEDLEIGKGYWILAMNDTDVEINGAPYVP